MNYLKRLGFLSLLLGLFCSCFLCSCSSHRIRNKAAISAAVDDARLMKQSSDITVRCVRLTNAEFREMVKSEKELPADKTDKLSLLWRLDISGLKPNCKYYFYQVNGLKQICFEEQLVFDADREILLKNYGLPLRNFTTTFEGYVDGEDSAFVVVSGEEVPEYAAGLVCPKPIFFSWKDGGWVRAWLADLTTKHYTLVGKNFLPNEPIVIVQDYGSAPRRNEIQADAEGGFMFLLSAYNEPLSGGTAVVTIERSEGRGDGLLKFLWGSEASAKENMYSDF